MFINNIDPVLLNIGPLELRYYGLVYAIGFLVTYLVLHHAVKTKRLHLTEEQLDSYFLWLIIISVLMARVFEVFIYNLPEYLNNPSEMYKIWHGGMSYHGGIAGVIIVTLIFAKKYKVRFYDILDIAALPAMSMLALGKLANYTNSELYGTITNVPWCVVFQRIDTYCRHPVQIYEFLLYMLLFAILAIYSKSKKWKKKPGNIFWMFMLLYGIARLGIAFLREEPVYLGLNVGQWLSIILIIVSIVFLWKTKPKNI